MSKYIFFVTYLIFYRARWNKSPQTSHKDEQKTSKNTCQKLLKILIIICIFLMVFGGSMLSKGTILLITSNMRKDIPMECSSWKLVPSIGEATNMNKTQCVLIGVYNHTVNATRPCAWLQNGTKFKSTVCHTLTVRWVWAGILVICTPYMFVFLKSFLNLIVKRKAWPSPFPFLLVSIILNGKEGFQKNQLHLQIAQYSY